MKKFLILVLLLAPMSLCAQKFGHFNSADIIQAMPEYATAQTELQALGKQYEDELTRMQDEFKTKYEEYQKNEATYPEATKQRRQQELTELNNRLEQFYQTSQQDLQKQQQDKMALITEKVSKAIKEVGDAGGYVYIMDVTSGIPYINESISTDVTDQVKTKLGIK